MILNRKREKKSRGRFIACKNYFLSLTLLLLCRFLLETDAKLLESNIKRFNYILISDISKQRIMFFSGTREQKKNPCKMKCKLWTVINLLQRQLIMHLSQHKTRKIWNRKMIRLSALNSRRFSVRHENHFANNKPAEHKRHNLSIFRFYRGIFGKC